MTTELPFYGHITNDGAIDCTPGRVEFIAERNKREAEMWERASIAARTASTRRARWNGLP